MSAEIKPVRTKFAVGHFLTEKPDDPKSFSELAKRYATRLLEVYFPWPNLYNARGMKLKTEEDEQRVVEDLTYCRNHGMRLDVLANASCYGERAFTEEQREQICGMIRRMDHFGLYPEILTTTSPYIAKVVKMNFPDIEIRASVNMRLRNTLAFEYLAPLFDSYYICRDVQRDIPTFQRMAKWCSDHGKKMCMLANSGCVRNCPWQVFHESLLAHKFPDAFPEMVLTGLELVCNKTYNKGNFTETLRSSWIRPEDVHVFEPYLETIKLSTREADAPFTIVEAYVSGHYKGNLLKLLDPSYAYYFRPNRIENSAFPQDWVTSGIGGKCADNCVHCGKCEKVLEQVSKYDVDETARAKDFSFSPNFVLYAPPKSGKNVTQK